MKYFIFLISSIICLLQTPQVAAAAAPAAIPGITYYLSPAGDDSRVGLSTAEPMKTFAAAVPRLQPGDRIILMDGIYTKTTTGLPDIDCSPGSSAANGTASLPIAIMAQHERQAHLQSDGSQPALGMKHCSYWTLTGLRGSSADLSGVQSGKQSSVFQIHHSSDIVLRRLISSHNNRYFNDHLYEIAYSARILVEESEGYAFNRHAFSFYQDRQVTVRRSYAHARNYGDLAGGYVSNNPSGGDEAFVLYCSSDSLVENSIAEGDTQGFQVHGCPDEDGITPMGENNRFLGNISIGNPSGQSDNGAKLDTRIVNNIVWPVKNNLLKNMLIMDTGSAGIFLEGAVNARIENLTLYTLNDDGIQVKDGSAGTGWCDDPSHGCDVTVLNTLIYNGKKYGLTVRNNTKRIIKYSNVYSSIKDAGYTDYHPSEPIADTAGYIRYSLSEEPTMINPAAGYTPIYIPAGATMSGKGENGADIGATILYRYQDGLLSNEPLWNPASGAFPCGVVVSGINDSPDSSCTTVHTRLNVHAATLPYVTSSPAPTTTPGPSCHLRAQGDADCDGYIKLADYAVWRAEFYSEQPTQRSDFNGDSRISLADFEIWRSSFNAS